MIDRRAITAFSKLVSLIYFILGNAVGRRHKVSEAGLPGALSVLVPAEP